MTSHEHAGHRYDVPEEAALPEAAEWLSDGRIAERVHDVGIEASTSTVTYVDTADLVLWRSGWALVRGADGADPGWRLHASAGDGGSAVIRAAAGRSVRPVPIAIRRLTWILTREQALAPVAEVTIERAVHRFVDADGHVVAEVVDERTTGVALADRPSAGEPAPLTWREIRVEPTDAESVLTKRIQRRLRRLGAELAEAPTGVHHLLGRSGDWAASATVTHKKSRRRLSPRSSAGPVVVAYLAEQVDQIRLGDTAVRLDQPDSIHHLRVAVRRWRTALDTFEALFDGGPVADLRAELGWFAGELGEARDAEVLRTGFLDLVDEHGDQPTAVGRIVAGVDRDLRLARVAAHRAVLAGVNSERYRALIDSLERFVAEPPVTGRAGKRADAELPRHVRRAYDRLKVALGQAEEQAGEGRDLALHEARKLAKTARYAAEAVRPALGQPARAFASAMEDLQEVLGEHHDNVVLRQRLRSIAEGADPALAFLCGQLSARQERRQERTELEIQSVWRVARAGSLRRWLS